MSHTQRLARSSRTAIDDLGCGLTPAHATLLKNRGPDNPRITPIFHVLTQPYTEIYAQVPFARPQHSERIVAEPAVGPQRGYGKPAARSLPAHLIVGASDTALTFLDRETKRWRTCG